MSKNVGVRYVVLIAIINILNGASAVKHQSNHYKELESSLLSFFKSHRTEHIDGDVRLIDTDNKYIKHQKKI